MSNFAYESHVILLFQQVSNLFAKDELDEITQELISVMKKELPRCPPTFENLYDFFISRARTNLHTVLCFSPVCISEFLCMSTVLTLYVVLLFI